MSKFSLEIEEDFDFFMLGICSHIKDYRLCWEINHEMDIDLIKDQNLEVVENGEQRSFTFNAFEGGDSPNDYYLIGNKSEYGYLVPEEKTCDYFMIIKGPMSSEHEKEIVKTLNASKNILTCYRIEPLNLKSKNNLIF